jgi:hypothetical protein
MGFGKIICLRTQGVFKLYRLFQIRLFISEAKFFASGQEYGRLLDDMEKERSI